MKVAYILLKPVLAFLSLLFISFSHPLYGKEEADPKPAPPKIGNFALPTSQQPSPLISFGQHVIDKGQGIFFFFADYFAGKRKHATDLIPSLLYGIEDDLSIFLAAPVAPRFKDQRTHSSGWEDIFAQLEYAPYNNQTKQYSDQITLLSGVSFPTGSALKLPPTGWGAPTFFLGTTLSRLYTDWLAFTSYGVFLSTSNEHTKLGNQFLYQWGVGRNIYSIPSELIFTGMVEITGLYDTKNKIRGLRDPNSGGNVIYVTPSLWLSTEKYIVQLGVGFPVAQHLFGQQTRNHYLLAGTLAYTF